MGLLAALTIKVSAILFLALVAAFCVRRSSACTRRWVLAVGVVSAVAAPALHVLPLPAVVQLAPVGPLAYDLLRLLPDVLFGEPADAGLPGPAVAPQPAGPRRDRSRPAAATIASEVVGRLAVTIWLVGAVAGAGVLLVGLARLRWLRASSSRVTDGPWHRLGADLARSCGLRRGFDLLLGPRPGLVATWGWRRPAVMLPQSASEWSPERMRVVLLHELAHARRGDWMLQMAAEALRCVWWFNPLAWMVRARLRRESEHAADDLVLAQGVPPATCATHLVELARVVRKHRRTWLPAPAMARPSHLERRLSTMLNSRTNRRPMTRLARFGSLGVLVPASIVVAGLQVGPVSASRSAESIGSAVGQDQAAEPSSERITEFGAVGAALQDAAAAALQERVQVGSGVASRSAESTGNVVGQDQAAEPSSERIAELVARAAALQEQLQAVLDELQAVLDDPDPPAADSTEPVRVGSGVRPPTKVQDVPPVYPPEARTARVQGVVILEATISTTGEVSDVEILRSVPLLDEAAVAAVRQWRYEPTLVDGVAVPILMTITMNFMLPSP